MANSFEMAIASGSLVILNYDSNIKTVVKKWGDLTFQMELCVGDFTYPPTTGGIYIRCLGPWSFDNCDNGYPAIYVKVEMKCEYSPLYDLERRVVQKTFSSVMYSKVRIYKLIKHFTIKITNCF